MKRKNLNWMQKMVRWLFSTHCRMSLCILVVVLTFLLTACYFIFLCFGSIDVFWGFLERLAFSLGGKALSFPLRGLGCSGGLALAIAFLVKTILTPDGASSIGNWMVPESNASAASSEASVNQPPGRNGAGPSNLDSLDSSDKEFLKAFFQKFSVENEVEQPLRQPPVDPGALANSTLQFREEVKDRLHSFLQSHSKISVKWPFFLKTQEELGIDEASYDRLKQIDTVIQSLSQLKPEDAKFFDLSTPRKAVKQIKDFLKIFDD